LQTPPITIVWIPPAPCHSIFLELQCYSPLGKEKYKDVLYFYLRRSEMENVEDENT
jgi:hypothetical protein